MRQNRLIAAIDFLGSVLILQLAFFLFSIPVITIFPAAAALQRQFGALREGYPTGIAPFAKEFRTAWRKTWPLGIAVPLISVGFAVALPFWFQTPPPIGWIGSGFLAFLFGLACAFYLNLLWAARELPEASSRELARAAFVHLAGNGLRSLWGVILFACWILVLKNFLVLGLIGSGIVPALIVYYTVTTRTRQPDDGDAG